jgi:hypothetical protein
MCVVRIIRKVWNTPYEQNEENLNIEVGGKYSNHGF